MSRIVATIGLHGSASTWVYNVVRELLIAAHGEESVLGGYADDMTRVPDEAARAGRILVLKSHHGSAELDDWLLAQGATLILSVRDPRDCALSMHQRFGSPLAAAARWIGNDCARMMKLATEGRPLLVYETRFFEDRLVPRRLALALGLQLQVAVMDTIFARYEAAAVRELMAKIPHLPDDRRGIVANATLDLLTQYLTVHLGDASSGKFLSLPQQARDEMARFYAPFLARFGYVG